MANLSTNQIKRYIENLNEAALRQITIQLLIYPDSSKFIEKCIEEFDKFYEFPLKVKK